MNNTKANLWLFNKKTKDITFSYETKQKFRFIKGSLIAVVLGLIVGGIIIAVQNVNPFEWLGWVFKIGFNDIFANRTISWLCIYIVAALAVGIGFKAGMFNIGVAGQMMAGGGIGIIYYKKCVDKTVNNIDLNIVPNGGQIIVIFLICIASGALMAAIAGALKALFNIHEVVTTIMLNWTVWYLMKYLFTTVKGINGQGIQASGQIPGGSLNVGGSPIIIPIILAAISVIVIALLLARSTFGFKLKSVGASPSASKYAGYSVKSKMIEAMAISGLLAGVASFISIFTIAPQYTFNVDSLPSVGYDSIAITLVAFNNPVGIVFSSFLWATLQSAGSSASSMFNLPTQMSQLIFGVIVYFAAISVVFINWYPIIKLKIMIALTGSKENQLKIKDLRKAQLDCRKKLMNVKDSKEVQEYKKLITDQINEQKVLLANAKTKQEQAVIKQNIKSLKNDMNFFVKEYRNNLKEMIKKCSEQIKIIKKDTYVEKINSAKEGINRREFERIQNIEQNALSKSSLIKSDVLSLKDTYKKDLKAKTNWYKNKLGELKKEYKLKLTQNSVWFESETGIKNQYWEMRNGKIESKAKINKIKIDAHNEILNLKSDYQMDVLALKSEFKNQPELLSKKEEALKAKLNKQINIVRTKEAQQIKTEKETVNKLIETYKSLKAKNEKEQRRILADKKAVEIKKQEISEILDVWDNRLATLVDIKLAYQLKNKQVDEWYAEQKQQIKNVYVDLQNLHDDQKAEANYQVVSKALIEYKNSIKQMGNKNDLQIVKDKKALLSKLVKQVKSVWKEEYSVYENNEYSKLRYKTYLFINKEQAKLNTLGIVISSENEIKYVKEQTKSINKLYNENIKQFKNEYLANKKVNVVMAQQKYHLQIEDFINDLEKQSFKSLKEVK